jgi:glycerol-3-phosphate O-acyltransferase
MDVLGNYVDQDGRTIDKNGRQIDTKDYFMSEGKVTVDAQREEEYTNMLGKRIVEEFHKINRVFSSHLLSFTAFEMIKKENPKLDLFELLRLPEEDLLIPVEEFKQGCQMVLDSIFDLKSKSLIMMAPHLNRDIEEIIRHGLDNVGMYHAKRPLIRDFEDNITTQDMSLLYFYHNRLTGYGLEKLF